MTDRPIIFSAPMVRALLDGRKTQTRRILKLPKWASTDPSHIEFGASGEPEVICRDTGCLAALPMPYAVGDRLWVRENHRFAGGRYNDGRVGEANWSEDEWFRCYGGGGCGDNWDPSFPPDWRPSEHMQVADLTGPGHDEGPDVERFATKVLPSIHMPRWASRLTLVVTDVRVERLQDISEADAVVEGLKPDTCAGQRMWDPGTPHGLFGDPRVAFRMLWEDINGPGAWEANPWVAAVSFTVHRANIAALDIGAAA
ncbi:hypothetical protein [Methylobacterium sp. V23]|uniref:hypothetical protein n=1 Tax=Methylobacterium sp. V23 TaxID=2044878 RepID=UPI000CDA251F|nr:hypothetical protein [Methylobacterium sp. V23]POR42524.1 hypothetical protein CRT23_12080 [Methylobacterium sp. V23]